MNPFSENTCWFIFIDAQILLVKDKENYSLPTGTLANKLKAHLIRQHSLKQSHVSHYYCGELDKYIQLPSHIHKIPLREAFLLLNSHFSQTIIRAFSIINWDKEHQYCGRCGTRTEFNPTIFEKICPSCKLLHYPHISPSVITLIEKEDHILMARSPHFPLGVYGLIAGFIESGESAEEATHREVKEEVGITIKNLRYFGSQAWPFPDSLMIAFISEYDSGEIIIDQNEIESANWYYYNALPRFPSSNISIAKKLIDFFIEKQK